MSDTVHLSAPPDAVQETVEGKTASLLRYSIRRFLQNKTAVLGLILLMIFILAAIFAPFITPYGPTDRDYRARLKPPSANHILGTDYLGRDLFTRIVYGARISLQVGLISVGVAMVAGVTLGAIAGYFGGFLDLLIMRAIDIMLAFPSILLAIAIMAILGPSLANAMLAIGIVSIPTYARLVRSSVLSVRNNEFIEAAVALGMSNTRIIFRHILPNSLAPIIVQATLGVATAILDAAGLSFLGLGAQPPTPEWGAILSECRPYLRSAPWTVAFPGLAIVLVVLALNLVGDGLRDALDPRLKR